MRDSGNEVDAFVFQLTSRNDPVHWCLVVVVVPGRLVVLPLTTGIQRCCSNSCHFWK